MQTWRSTKRPGVYIAHQTKCPATADPAARCRCKPSYRGRRRHPVTGKPIWQKATKDRAEVLTWLADAELAAELAETEPHARASLDVLGDEWLDGVESGVIGRRRGKGKPYSETTIANYRRSWQHVLRPEFGPMVAEEISEVEWQMWVDQFSREGLSRSRIANHVAVASSIYTWALSPSRRFVTRNPLRMVELPPNDEKPRLRVALVPEAEQLLAALEPEDRVPYALACYAGHAPLGDRTGSNGRRSSTTARSPAMSSCCARRARPARSAARRSPSRCSRSSVRRGCGKAGQRKGRYSSARSCQGSLPTPPPRPGSAKA